MKYIELGKLYYMDRERYEQTYRARITSPDTVMLNFWVKGNQAFFVRTAEVSDLALQILKADKKIGILHSKLPGAAIAQFTKRCLVDEILLTNKIEGVYSTRREILTVLNEVQDTVEKKRGRKRFYGLVAKYLRLQNGEPVPLDSCRDIRALYDEIVLPEVVEENPRNAPDGQIFRKDSASVTTATDKEIHRGVYPESVICEEMEKALKILKMEELELLYRAGIFHYALEYIHPFYDGNGRLGRFIVSCLLSTELDPLLAYRLSYTITENISKYYDAFKVCNDPRNMGDVTPFVLMMLEMIRRSTEQLKEALERRCAALDRYEDKIQYLPREGGRTASAYYVLVQAALFAEHGISTRELTRYLDTSYSTAKKELTYIDALGLLKREKVGREKFYALDLERMDQIVGEEMQKQKG